MLCQTKKLLIKLKINKMELITINNSIENQIIPEEQVITKYPKRNFIEANTKQVTLEHLKKDCTIPVFTKDNETTISHYQFIDKTRAITQNIFPEAHVNQPDIRVSHNIKGRIPSAIGKPASELQEHEKTLFYERCAFVIEIPSIKQNINGNELSLAIGGVRAYNQENLYSRKSLEKFKVFVGFQNRVCTNLCVSTDGFSNEIRIGSITELEDKVSQLIGNYNMQQHLNLMQELTNYELSEVQFAHFVGKARMYGHLSKSEQQELFSIELSDSQINQMVKQYYTCDNFGRNADGSINLWKLYNLFTETNKSSYIDSNLERNVSAFELVNNVMIT